MSALFDRTRKNQHRLDCLDRRKSCDARQHVGDIAESFALARAHAHVSEPTRYLLPHDLVAEAGQVGPVWNLETDADGYRQQEQEKRQPIFTKSFPGEKQQEPRRRGRPRSLPGCRGVGVGLRENRRARWRQNTIGWVWQGLQGLWPSRCDVRANSLERVPFSRRNSSKSITIDPDTKC